MYDYLIVGAGLFGSTFARLMFDSGKKCLIIDSRNHIGGNCYTYKHGIIDVHAYGPHIFHTNNEMIWNFVNRFSHFNNFQLNVKSNVNNKMYSLPFNMNTFYEMWGCTTPLQAQEIINKQKLVINHKPRNLEEYALSQVGHDIYNTLIRDYTIKQWNKDPKDLPASIIARLPLRFTYNNNYFNDNYQGIPIDGYTRLFEKMLSGTDVILNVNYFANRDYWNSRAKRIVFTGKIDEFFEYEYGELEYRSLKFEHSEFDYEHYQGTSIVNYPSLNIPYTRVVEHKHFTNTSSSFTIITKEHPTDSTGIPCYPINNEVNNSRYNKYYQKTKNLNNVIFGGRLAEYKYYDMHHIIGSAMKAASNELYK